MAFGSVAQFFVDEGGARFVGRGEMRREVTRRREQGLVFFTGNVTAPNPNLICTCCACCCRMLEGIIRPSPSILIAPPSRLIELDEQRCDHCGRCVPACNLGAHRLERRRHRLDVAACVGCGLCLPVCREGALRLVDNPRHRRPA